MVGNVGDDTFGKDYLKGLEDEGSNSSGVSVISKAKTGISNIIVDESSGENRILFTANANNAYSERPDASWDLVPSSSHVVVFQLEIPLPVVLHNMHLAREKGKHIIFNPAPASLIPDSAYQDIDTLIMNETESQILSAKQDHPTKDLPPAELAHQFLKWGVKEAVIITLGSKGVVYATASGETGSMEARKVRVVDTTAAGDTFVGAYAVHRSKWSTGSLDYQAALQFATHAASKSVEKPGAMAAIPRLSDLE